MKYDLNVKLPHNWSTEYQIDGITVTGVGLDDFTEDEARLYVKYVCSRVTGVREITVKAASDNKVDVDYVAVNKFERIRRITGYLSGDIRSWNDAKQSEERERVKHF